MNKQYYYCYSHPLKNYLLNNGLRYVIKGIHPNTNKRYWIFERSHPKLDSLLTQWQLNK